MESWTCTRPSRSLLARSRSPSQAAIAGLNRTFLAGQWPIFRPHPPSHVPSDHTSTANRPPIDSSASVPRYVLGVPAIPPRTLASYVVRQVSIATPSADRRDGVRQLRTGGHDDEPTRGADRHLSRRLPHLLGEGPTQSVLRIRLAPAVGSGCWAGGPTG